METGRFSLKFPLVRRPSRWLPWLLLALIGHASLAHAHGFPGVSGILDQDESGVHILRLLQGIVLREGSAWRYVCSKTYNGGGQDIAAALPGGGVAISIPTGIAIMKRDGTAMVHPDPEAAAGQAPPTAFARSKDKLYALRYRDQFKAGDVIEITDTTVKILWSDEHYWSDIAVGENSLALVRADQDEIDELRLSFTGEVLSQDKAMLTDTYAVNVAVMGDVPYYSVRLRNTRVMGRIEQGMWKQVLMSGNAMAGPLVMPDGTTFVATDGVLATFANEMATPLAENIDFVTGLAQLDGRPYACTSTALRDLSSAGLGEKIFDISDLVGPDECLLPEEMRAECELEWQHTQIEFLGANIMLAPGDTSDTMCDTSGSAGVIAAGTGAAGSGAVASAVTGAAGKTAVPTAGAPMPSASAGAGGEGSGSETMMQGSNSSGCACGMVPRAPRGAAATYTLLVACAWYLRRRRKYL